MGISKCNCLWLQDVLALMEAENVKPNDSTWEALAYTCHHYADIEKFLYHIGQHEKTPSDKTLRRLIKNIGHTKSHYKLYNLCHLMKYISENKLKPSEKTIQVLDSIVEQCEELKNKKVKYTFPNKFPIFYIAIFYICFSSVFRLINWHRTSN